jgi:hypothetical protein
MIEHPVVLAEMTGDAILYTLLYVVRWMLLRLVLPTIVCAVIGASVGKVLARRRWGERANVRRSGCVGAALGAIAGFGVAFLYVFCFA